MTGFVSRRYPRGMLSADRARQVIERIAQGESSPAVLREFGSTWTQLWEAIDRDPLIASAYAQARERRADVLADQIVEIADSEDDQMRAKNRIDARKWIASKMQPRTYGDRIDMNVNGQVDLVGVLADARARLRPVSNQRGEAIVQDADFTPIAAPRLTDPQSVPAVPALPPELE